MSVNNLYIRQIAESLLKMKHRTNESGIVFFLGAGFSMRSKEPPTSGLGSGAELAGVLGEDLEIKDEKNLQRVSEYYEVTFGKASLIDAIKKYIKNEQKPQLSHAALVDLIEFVEQPREFVFTVNYDTLLEDCYRDIHKKSLEVWKFGDDYNNNKHIYKIHGCISAESNLVVTSEDYYNVKSHEVLMKKLFSILRENTCVFIGFSMEDQDLVDLLFNIRANHSNLGKKHYLVVPETGVNSMRAKYLRDKFNIEHLPMKGDEFLEAVKEELKKKVKTKE